MLGCETWQRPRNCSRNHHRKPDAKCRNLKEMKNQSGAKWEKKLLKKPRGNVENTYQYMWMAKTVKSLSDNITWTTTKMHQICQNLSWFISYSHYCIRKLNAWYKKLDSCIYMQSIPDKELGFDQVYFYQQRKE